MNSVLVTGNGTGRVELSIFGIERWVYNWRTTLAHHTNRNCSYTSHCMALSLRLCTLTINRVVITRKNTEIFVEFYSPICRNMACMPRVLFMHAFLDTNLSNVSSTCESRAITNVLLLLYYKLFARYSLFEAK